MSKIYIEVEGGTVQAVWGPPDSTDVVLIDHDNMECDEEAETRGQEALDVLSDAIEKGELVCLL